MAVTLPHLLVHSCITAGQGQCRAAGAKGCVVLAGALCCRAARGALQASIYALYGQEDRSFCLQGCWEGRWAWLAGSEARLLGMVGRDGSIWLLQGPVLRACRVCWAPVSGQKSPEGGDEEVLWHWSVGCGCTLPSALLGVQCSVGSLLFRGCHRSAWCSALLWSRHHGFSFGGWMKCWCFSAVQKWLL